MNDKKEGKADKTTIRIQILSPTIQKSTHIFLEEGETCNALLAIDELMKKILGDDYDKAD